MPRQDGGTGNDIFEAEVLVSDTADGYEMGTAASMGTFTFDNGGAMLTDRGDWKQMSFGATRGRYVTVKVLHAGGGSTLTPTAAWRNSSSTLRPFPIRWRRTTSLPRLKKVDAEGLQPATP